MTMIERAARAIKDELRRQGVLWENGEAPNELMMCTGETADLTALARAALLAIREMLDDKADIDGIIVAVLSNCAVSHDGSIGVDREAVVKALGGVIDEALKEAE